MTQAGLVHWDLPKGNDCIEAVKTHNRDELTGDLPSSMSMSVAATKGQRSLLTTVTSAASGSTPWHPTHHTSHHISSET